MTSLSDEKNFHPSQESYATQHNPPCICDRSLTFFFKTHERNFNLFQCHVVINIFSSSFIVST